MPGMPDGVCRTIEPGKALAIPGQVARLGPAVPVATCMEAGQVGRRSTHQREPVGLGDAVQQVFQRGADIAGDQLPAVEGQHRWHLFTGRRPQGFRLGSQNPVV